MSEKKSITGKVVAVNISEVKGTSKHPVEYVECVKDFGIKGDAHGGSGIRQISLLSKERIGTALLEVSQIGKKCHADQGCEIAKKYGVCAMPKEGIFAVVVEEGIIKADDKIELSYD